MPVAVMALQKLEHIKGLLYRDNILSDISAMRPVDCVGLPPDISIIKLLADKIFDVAFLLWIKRCGILPTLPLLSHIILLLYSSLWGSLCPNHHF